MPSASLIEKRAPLQPVDECGEIFIHQADDLFLFWQAWEEECGCICPIPFWALVWPAAGVMSRYILNRPELVRDKHVLEIGSGCGVVAIAAALAGARVAAVNDIDPIALEMAAKNAGKNRACIVFLPGNLMREMGDMEEVEVILAADMFYLQEEAKEMVASLNHAFEKGKTIFIADGGRPFSPRKGLSLLEERVVPVNFDVEGVVQRKVRLYRVSGTLG